MMSDGHYPALAALNAEGDVELDLDSVCEFGLRNLLDGYATLIEGSGAAR